MPCMTLRCVCSQAQIEVEILAQNGGGFVSPVFLLVGC